MTTIIKKIFNITILSSAVLLISNCSSNYSSYTSSSYDDGAPANLEELMALNKGNESDYKYNTDYYTDIGYAYESSKDSKNNKDNNNDAANKAADNQNVVTKNNTIREIALAEIALSLGMRSGLYYRSREINNFLVQNSSNLDKIFDFRGLMLPNNIMPPVLIEARKTMDAVAHEPLPTDEDTFLLNNNPSGQSLAKSKIRVERAQNNFRTLRITDRVYKIIRQARFAVTTPSWRDYLHLKFVAPGMPETSLLPDNASEQEVWARSIKKGWKLGLEQGDQILNQNLMLLKRDYLGMVRYRTLLAKNMVSAPYVAKRNYGVTGDGDEIKIHDRVLTIAALPALKPDSSGWTPYLTQNEEQELDTRLSMLDFDRLLSGIKNGKGYINPKEFYKK